MRVRFEWDPAKASANLRKNGVSFETARHVFQDPLARSEVDRWVEGEQRWQTLGLVDGALLLLVAHTTTEEDEQGLLTEIIRIISARAADRKERRRYENESSKPLQ